MLGALPSPVLGAVPGRLLAAAPSRVFGADPAAVLGAGSSAVFGADPLLVGYVAVFLAAGVACLASLARVDRIESADTRRGFAGLLVLSGAWALAHAGFLVAPGRSLKVAFYVAGLVAGFAAVGAWLYFCSAYSGRALHRDPRIRRLALGVFLAATAVKVTNPAHGYYFSATMVSEPFRYLAVENHVLHWVLMGASYSLAAVGYFLLFELFDRTSIDTRPLVGLAALTALPVAANVLGYTSPVLLDITYEPIGVAAFAVGVLFGFVERFRTVQLTGDVDEPLVFVDEDGRVKEFNGKARELFPGLADATGRPLADALPDVAAALEDPDGVLEREVDGEPRYYLVAANPFTVGRTTVGRMLLVSDVTRSERHRRELERQNERLSQFASVLSHDLRNPLNVAKGRVDLVRDGRADEHLDAVAGALDRMEALIEDILTLARHGETIGETESCGLAGVAREAWANVDTRDATLEVAGDRVFEADRTRLVQLFENLFRNAVEHAGGDATVTVGATDDGFFVADDGPGIPREKREEVFEPGFTTAEDGTGFGLAIVGSIAAAHDWTVTAGESETGGARFEFAGVGAATDHPTEEPHPND